MRTLTLTVALATAPVFAQTTYTIDPAHSSAQFSVRHLMISNVRGEFSGVSGAVAYDAKNPAATKIDATIDIATINTREPKRDEHLKSADFFDVAKFPKMTFHSKQAWSGGGKLHVKGDLTMHGVTREVVLDIEGPTAETKDPWGNQRLGASASAKLNRKDWGLNWNQMLEAGGVAVGDEVSITIDVEAIRKK